MLAGDAAEGVARLHRVDLLHGGLGLQLAANILHRLEGVDGEQTGLGLNILHKFDALADHRQIGFRIRSSVLLAQRMCLNLLQHRL